MNCRRCCTSMRSTSMRMIDWKTNGGKKFVLFKCDSCGYEQEITDPEIANRLILKNKLLNPENHSHNAFVYQAITRNGRLSTIGLMALCLDAGITNGRREARKLKQIGLLSNYKENGKRYVVWHTKELE